MQSEPFWVTIGAPIATHGANPTPDGWFTSLVAHIPLHANNTSAISVGGSLDAPDPNFVVPLFADSGIVTIPAGDSVEDLSFPGMPLYARGYDGAYNLRVQITLPYGGQPMTQTSTRTAWYNHTEFVRTSAEPVLAGMTSAVVPAPDPTANVLRIQVPILVRTAGDYDLRGSLLDLSTEHIAHLGVGNQTMTLSFSGIQLSRLGTPAPWPLWLTVRHLGGSVWDWVPRVTETANVPSSALIDRPVAYLNGTVSWASTGFAPVVVFLVEDPTTRFFLEGYAGPALSPASIANYSLPLYPGNFTLFATQPGGGASYDTSFTVAGNRSMNLSLAPVPGEPENASITFPDWGHADIHTDSSVSPLAADQIRLLADAAGDLDGVANRSELDFYLEAEIATGFDGVSVDTHYWPAIPASTQTEAGPGPVLSRAELRWIQDTVAAGDANATASHVVDVPVVHPGPSQPSILGVTLPPGYTGALTVPSRVDVENLARGSWRFTILPVPTAPPVFDTITIRAEPAIVVLDPFAAALLGLLAVAILATAFGPGLRRRRNGRS